VTRRRKWWRRRAAPTPPRNAQLHIHGHTIPLELRYDGMRYDHEARRLLHRWTAVARYPTPTQGTEASLSVDELPARTQIIVEFAG
jgi:hypothetical protein